MMQSESKPEISIIVPVYNVEKYLRECLDSILRQDYTNWECILVDDGSRDSGGAICDEYARRDSRFLVVHQPNRGLSAARNTGIKMARGKFLSFIDSDDWVAPDFLSTLRSLLIDFDADISQINYTSVYKDKERPRESVAEIKVIEGTDILMEILHDRDLPSYVWMKMFRREMVVSDFPVGVNFEDIETMTRWFHEAKRVILSPKICYYYRHRGSSIMNSNYWKNQLDYFRNIVIRVELMRSFIPEAFSRQEQVRHIIICGLNAAKSIARNEKNPEHRIEGLNAIRDVLKRLPVKQVENLTLKRRLRLKMLLDNPARFAKHVRRIRYFEFNYYTHSKDNSFE